MGNVAPIMEERRETRKLYGFHQKRSGFLFDGIVSIDFNLICG